MFDRWDPSGMTHWDEARRIAHICRLIKEGSMSPNEIDANGMTPLVACSQARNLEMVRFLIEHGADVNLAVTNDEFAGRAPLLAATLDNFVRPLDARLEVVQCLLLAKADANGSAPTGSTPLYGSAWKGEIEVVRCLLDAKADMNKGPQGFMPLHVSARCGHYEMVRCLVAAGADVNKPSQSGRLRGTPLHEALQRGHGKIARFLVKHGATEIDRSEEGGFDSEGKPVDFDKLHRPFTWAHRRSVSTRDMLARHRCHHCHKLGKDNKCACGKVSYCSKACQEDDRPLHRPFCSDDSAVCPCEACESARCARGPTSKQDRFRQRLGYTGALSSQLALPASSPAMQWPTYSLFEQQHWYTAWESAP